MKIKNNNNRTMVRCLFGSGQFLNIIYLRGGKMDAFFNQCSHCIIIAVHLLNPSLTCPFHFLFYHFILFNSLWLIYYNLYNCEIYVRPVFQVNIVFLFQCCIQARSSERSTFWKLKSHPLVGKKGKAKGFPSPPCLFFLELTEHANNWNARIPVLCYFDRS